MFNSRFSSLSLDLFESGISISILSFSRSLSLSPKKDVSHIAALRPPSLGRSPTRSVAVAIAHLRSQRRFPFLHLPDEFSSLEVVVVVVVVGAETGPGKSDPPPFSFSTASLHFIRGVSSPWSPPFSRCWPARRRRSKRSAPPSPRMGRRRCPWSALMPGRAALTKSAAAAAVDDPGSGSRQRTSSGRPSPPP